MAWVDGFLKYATSTAIKAECERRQLHKQQVSTLPPATVYREITGQQLIDMLPKTFVDPFDGKTYGVRLTMGNPKYRLTTDAEIRRFLAWNRINERKPTPEWYVCNSYALSLWAAARDWTEGVCLGMCVVRRRGHGMNWYINQDGKKMLIEPQNDTIIPGFDDTIEHFLV
jgi:hypothetical protein